MIADRSGMFAWHLAQVSVLASLHRLADGLVSDSVLGAMLGACRLKVLTG
ncbi:MAG TPA: hypothetical protein VFB39_14265 [Solirubrobacteraceae bacterium]|nr:hypothetical protein [Solirubrobacteraceae bacterium]